MSGRLDGRSCIVTGAAGGIGREIVAAFEREGARVAGVDLAEGAPGSVSLQADLTDEQAVAAAVGAAVDALGGLDVLVCAAGAAPAADGPGLATSLETWRRVQEINLQSVFLSCKHAVPALADGGAVVLVSSVVALRGSAEAQISYDAAKAGVLALARDLAVDLAPRGVRVNAVCPGPIRTPLLDDMGGIDEAAAARRFQHIPLARLGEPAEVAGTILFLASGEASYITGVALPVDGGLAAAYLTAEPGR